jgi:hypothetical protein
MSREFQRDCRWVGCGLALILSPMAHGARPLITDDARIVDPKACQIESWVKHSAHVTELWALPACNALGNLEMTAGGAQGWREAAGTRTGVLVQGKTLLRPLQANDWGIGLAAGVLRPPDQPRDALDRYVYVPISIAWPDEQFVLHTNLGAARLAAIRQTRWTWGIGSETRLGERTLLIAEAYGQERESANFQAGLRHWVQPNRIQIDATVGDRVGSGQRAPWITVGLRLLSTPFLP